MADKVIEKTETVQKESPRDTVVVHEKEPRDKGSNVGLIIGIIIVVLLLLLLFGRGLFSSSSGGSSAPSSSSSQP